MLRFQIPIKQPDSAAYGIHLAENTGYTGLRESTLGLKFS